MWFGIGGIVAPVLIGNISMARVFFGFTWICILLFWWPSESSSQETVLPQGDARAPLVSRHFPDRVHAAAVVNVTCIAAPTDRSVERFHGGLHRRAGRLHRLHGGADGSHGRRANADRGTRATRTRSASSFEANWTRGSVRSLVRSSTWVSRQGCRSCTYST